MIVKPTDEILYFCFILYSFSEAVLILRLFDQIQDQKPSR